MCLDLGSPFGRSFRLFRQPAGLFAGLAQQFLLPPLGLFFGPPVRVWFWSTYGQPYPVPIKGRVIKGIYRRWATVRLLLKL